MKILTKNEEEEHYHATVIGGLKGGFLGLTVGIAAVYAGHRRFKMIRDLTLPMKAFLATSCGTFSTIISADRASRNYEASRHPSRNYRDTTSLESDQIESLKPLSQRLKDWGRTNRYSIVTASWATSMGAALVIVNRNKYLTGAQKLVQARIYAQGLTLAVLIASAALEVNDANSGKGRWETVKVLDPNDPDHKHLIEKRVHHETYAGEDLWKEDMVAAQERRIEARKAVDDEADKTHGPSQPPSAAERERK
ncbi:Respiratory supercomplex factor 2-like protein [Golovinomyces cichoracearum]|uniref:Respiratory supercomplex factor 2-like protein n=1 Tax=Golovinomyces cichoracearum TaxID=62708 RepID=A0A420H9F8_9PEZI|nr:Respiratory supercomplex factor 2-like protein [Golovinomyces cichoracearum]